MKRYLVLAALVLGACTPAQDQKIVATVNSTLTTVKADVAIAIKAVVTAVQSTCPLVATNVGTVEVLTAVVASVLGLPATGTVVVGLETSVAQVCAKIAAKIATP